MPALNIAVFLIGISLSGLSVLMIIFNHTVSRRLGAIEKRLGL